MGVLVIVKRIYVYYFVITATVVLGDRKTFLRPILLQPLCRQLMTSSQSFKKKEHLHHVNQSRTSSGLTVPSACKYTVISRTSGIVYSDSRSSCKKFQNTDRTLIKLFQNQV